MSNSTLSSNKKYSRGASTVVAVIIILVVAVIAFWALRGGEESFAPTPTPTPTKAMISPETEEAMMEGKVRTFAVSGKSFSFTPSEIRVKKGDTVKIVFTNEQGFHDWVIDEFNARTPQIKAGETAEVMFVANKTGSFEYYCSVGTHRQMGMKGMLIVE